jgi:hypothetical protein
MANTGRVTQSFLIAGTLQVGNARVTQSFLIAAIGLGISCGNPPGGVIGVAYSHTFPSGSGVAPLTFSIAAGFLPAGLMLNAATGAVTGVPTISGIFSFTVQVVDSLGAVASVACSITIPNSNIITLYGWKLYPNVPCDDVLPAVEAPSVDRAV